jgi:hypothetical protein
MSRKSPIPLLEFAAHLLLRSVPDDEEEEEDEKRREDEDDRDEEGAGYSE